MLHFLIKPAHMRIVLTTLIRIVTEPKGNLYDERIREHRNKYTTTDLERAA